jgi:hypothetical protein
LQTELYYVFGRAHSVLGGALACYPRRANSRYSLPFADQYAAPKRFDAVFADVSRIFRKSGLKACSSSIGLEKNQAGIPPGAGSNWLQSFGHEEDRCSKPSASRLLSVR